MLKSSAQFANAWRLGGLGLYADGTEFAPGGLAMVGERGRELVNLPRGSQVIPNHRTEAMLTNARGSAAPASSGPSMLAVHIHGANGDEHVRALVQQGVSAALSAQNLEMTRGGVGQQQQAYAARRG